MTLFIKDPQFQHYSDLRTLHNNLIWWCAHSEIFSQHGQFFKHSENDFHDGSRFFEANDHDCLDWADAALDKNPLKGYIDPKGQFYGVTSHLAFSDFLYSYGMNAATLETEGWLKVGQLKQGRLSSIYWQCASGNPTHEQKRMLKNLKLDEELPKVPPHDTNLRYEHIFGAQETEAMQAIRQKSAEKVKDRHRELTPDEARATIANLFPDFV